MRKNPTVSIIIINWNGLENTKNCLNSVLKITDVPFNILLIDNGSAHDEYKKLKKQYNNKIDLYGLEKNTGFTGGVNFGLKIAQERYKPDYYLLLNNDTIVEKNFLSALVKTASRDQKIGIVGPVIYDFAQKNKILYSGGKINWLFARPIHKKEKINKTEPATFITGCCFLIKKDLLNEIGLLDEKFFAYFEDTAYCTLAIQAGFTCVIEPKAVIYHKESSSLGKESKVYTYLFSRNRILFVNNYAHLFYKFYFFLFNLLKLLAVQTYFVITKRPQRMYPYMKGYIDGNLGMTGEPKI